MESFQKHGEEFFLTYLTTHSSSLEDSSKDDEGTAEVDDFSLPIEMKEKRANSKKLKSNLTMHGDIKGKIPSEISLEKEGVMAHIQKINIPVSLDTSFEGISMQPQIGQHFPKEKIEKLKKSGKKRKLEEIEEPILQSSDVHVEPFAPMFPMEFYEQPFVHMELSSSAPPLHFGELQQEKPEELFQIKKKKSGIHGLKEFRKTCKDWKNSPQGRIWTSSFRLLFTSNSKWTLSEEGKVWLKTLKGKNEVSSKSWEFLMARGFEHLQVIISEATGSMEINAALIYANMRCLRAVELQCNQTCSPLEPCVSSMSEFSSRKNRRKPETIKKKKTIVSSGTLNNPTGVAKEEYKTMILDLKTICENNGIFSEFDVPSTIDILKVVENILCKIDEVKLRKAAFGVGKWWYNTPVDCDEVFIALLNISKLLALHQVLIDKAPKNGIRCGPISAMIYSASDEEQQEYIKDPQDFMKVEAVRESSKKLLHETYYGRDSTPLEYEDMGGANIGGANIKELAQNVLIELGLLENKENYLETKYSLSVQEYKKADELLSKCIYSYCDEFLKPSHDETFGMETEDESIPSLPKPKQKKVGMSIEKAKEKKDAAELSLDNLRKQLAQSVAKQIFEKTKQLNYWFSDGTESPLGKTFSDNIAEKRQFCMEIKNALTLLGGQFSPKDEEIYKTI
jgi:hypothetical protein